MNCYKQQDPTNNAAGKVILIYVIYLFKFIGWALENILGNRIVLYALYALHKTAPYICLPQMIEPLMGLAQKHVTDGLWLKI